MKDLSEKCSYLTMMCNIFTYEEALSLLSQRALPLIVIGQDQSANPNPSYYHVYRQGDDNTIFLLSHIPPFIPFVVLENGSTLNIKNVDGEEVTYIDSDGIEITVSLSQLIQMNLGRLKVPSISH